jgi:hypothetical protein
VGSAGTMTPAPRQGATPPPARVLLLSESAGLAAVLSRLLGGDEQLTQRDSIRAATESGGFADHDAVVVDVPRRGGGTALEHLRRHYRGPLVVLVEWGADASNLPPDEARTLLARPFSAHQLRAALGLPPLKRRAGSLPSAAAAAAPAAQPEPPRQRGWPKGLRHVGPRRRRAEVLLSALAHGWRTRRWIRVAGFSTVSLLAFVLAFVLAAHGGGSDPGTQVEPPPTYPLDLPDTPTTLSRAPGPTAGREAVPGDGGFKGASASTTATSVRASTTMRPAAGGAATPPPTTRQPTTTGDPTTTDTTGATTTTVVQQSTP